MFKFFKKKKTTEVIPSDQIDHITDQPIESKSNNHIERHRLSRIERRERKWEKLQRRTLRWGVLRHFIMLDSANNIKHKAELKRWLQHWNNMKGIVGEVKDYELNEYDFKVLNRFIKLEKYKGQCEIEELPILTLQAYEKAQDPELDKIVIKFFNNYESYWDEILESYKRESDKKKRLQQLIEDLNHDINDPIFNIPAVQDYIFGLIDKYQHQLLEMK